MLLLLLSLFALSLLLLSLIDNDFSFSSLTLIGLLLELLIEGFFSEFKGSFKELFDLTSRDLLLLSLLTFLFFF